MSLRMTGEGALQSNQIMALIGELERRAHVSPRSYRVMPDLMEAWHACDVPSNSARCLTGRAVGGLMLSARGLGVDEHSVAGWAPASR